MMCFIALARSYLITKVHTPKLDVVLRALFGLCIASAVIALIHVPATTTLQFVLGNGVSITATTVTHGNVIVSVDILYGAGIELLRNVAESWTDIPPTGYTRPVGAAAVFVPGSPSSI